MTYKTLTPLHDKVIGKSVDDYGLRKTAGGLLINEKDGNEKSIRPRWFEITHVGPLNLDVKVGDYALVAHGRWSRGFTINESDGITYFHLDGEEILVKSEINPITHQNRN